MWQHYSITLLREWNMRRATRDWVEMLPAWTRWERGLRNPKFARHLDSWTNPPRTSIMQTIDARLEHHTLVLIRKGWSCTQFATEATSPETRSSKQEIVQKWGSTKLLGGVETSRSWESMRMIHMIVLWADARKPWRHSLADPLVFPVGSISCTFQNC